ncbi:MAG: hypothetical protein H6810_02250 [Phycisphaeraceae bacterium]|nr:MAG: hypothetical protein H6810_02250 [Phycisphaeraceae bacterium]
MLGRTEAQLLDRFGEPIYDTRRIDYFYSSRLPESEAERVEHGRDTDQDYRLIWFRSFTAIDVRMVDGRAVGIEHDEIH